jgi:hypothetical protein
LRTRECLAPEIGENSAFIGFRRDKLTEQEVRKLCIPDFSNWKNHNAFKKAFNRLKQDLRNNLAGK